MLCVGKECLLSARKGTRLVVSETTACKMSDDDRLKNCKGFWIEWIEEGKGGKGRREGRRVLRGDSQEGKGGSSGVR